MSDGIVNELQEINNKLDIFGLKMNSNYTSKNEKYEFEDNDGYKFSFTLKYVLNSSGNFERFSKRNPYTIYNIRNYISKNNIKSKLLSNTYINNTSLLLWECKCGENFECSWNDFLQGRHICTKCARSISRKDICNTKTNELKNKMKSKNLTLLSEYIKNDSPVYFICDIHPEEGKQETTWTKFIQKNVGCKICGKERHSKSRRIPESELIELTESKGFEYNGFYMDNETSHGGTTIKYICPKHRDKGIQIKRLADMRKNNGTCPYCVGKNRTHKEFVEIMNSINPNISFTSKYQKIMLDIECQCKKCGHKWITIPNRLLNGAGCPECANKKQSSSRLKSHKQFEEEINNKFNGNITLLSKYTKAKELIRCRCNIDGTEWETTATSLLSNGNIACPTCIGKMTSDRCRKTHEQFVNELSIANPNIEVLGKYTMNKNKIMCRCKIHNYTWQADPNHLLYRQTGCPRCASYHNENLLDKILNKWGYKFTAQKRFHDCRDKNTLPFDRYLDDFNILIEYDGEGHYKPIRRGKQTEEQAILSYEKVKKHDEIKTNYCKDKNIPLIRIPYWEKDNMEYFLFDEMVKYKAIEKVG